MPKCPFVHMQIFSSVIFYFNQSFEVSFTSASKIKDFRWTPRTEFLILDVKDWGDGTYLYSFFFSYYFYNVFIKILSSLPYFLCPSFFRFIEMKNCPTLLRHFPSRILSPVISIILSEWHNQLPTQSTSGLCSMCCIALYINK